MSQPSSPQTSTSPHLQLMGAALDSPQAVPRGSQLAGAILVLPLTEHLDPTRGAQGAREGGARSAASHPRAQLVQHKGGGGSRPPVRLLPVAPRPARLRTTSAPARTVAPAPE
jgi:hypothetical protein